MIAAVKLQDFSRSHPPRTASEWIAESYYEQSRSRLESAREAAREATVTSPEFGYAWTRLAEMEFSFGRTRQAMHALERGLQLAPRNAQAHSLRGFLLSAQNRIEPARASFEGAIRLDGALGNAWLGRGLTHIRQGNDELGRRDLQTAAVLEPNRSILRSYLGKAFSQVGMNAQSHQELGRAQELDPNDPTPWLYSAAQSKQENRYNAAVRDLETSLALNENRRVYRSQFLLDQDRGVRSTNLAAIYQNNGMTEVSVREAVRAVNSDYASAGAHLFLANSYNALRDPRRIVLRYETAWFNELLLANLLSPVGGGPLSQFVSQQEYSKLFEADRLGLSSAIDYFSTGELRQTASQFGVSGNLSYALDAEYQYDNGRRPNSDLTRFESYGTFKLQLGPQDTIFLQAKYQNLENGDVLQRYDARGVAQSGLQRTLRFREVQEPGLLLLGYHREWNPGVHTLLLLGRLANEQEVSGRDFRQTIVSRDISKVAPPDASRQTGSTTFAELQRSLQPFVGRGTVQRLESFDFDLGSRAEFEAYSAELNQIVQAGGHTFVAGARYQQGEFDTRVRLESELAKAFSSLFDDPPADQQFKVGLQRFSFYAYDFWRAARWLTLVAGASYDEIQYPDNFRSAPINDRDASFDKLSPKVGLVLTPWSGMTVRAAYSEALGGASFDESIRLEPTQIAGFNQAYRTVISESVAGSVAAPRYRSYGISVEQKLPSLTYLGIEISRLEQRVDRTLGAFDLLFTDRAAVVLPSSLEQRLEYREDVLLATANQLIGDYWSLGARYRFSKAELRQTLPGVARQISTRADDTDEAVLHEIALFGLFNHPSGFFARAEANWFNQENSGYAPEPRAPRNDAAPGDSFWHFNVFGGYRFFRNQCELSCGVLNLSGEDYRLNPLNLYTELPRDRTFVFRAKFSF
jgi:Flp pilus assembly protein TadD